MTNIIEDKLWKEYIENDIQEALKNSIPIHQRPSKIMNASEARAKLNKVIEEDNTELETIMEKINAAINRKQDYVYISSTIKTYTLGKLQQLGYRVGDIIKGDRPFDTDTRKISW